MPKTKFNIRNTVKEYFKPITEAYDVPNTVVEYAVFEAFTAWSNGISKYRETNKPFTLKYRDGRSKYQTISVDGRCFKDGVFYQLNTAHLLSKIFGRTVSKKEVSAYSVRLSESRKVGTEILKIIHDKVSGRFYLAIPIDVKPNQSQIHEKCFVSLDPGVRTFLTYYDSDEWGEYAKNDNKRIRRLFEHHDKVISKAKKCKDYHKKRRIYKAASRINAKVTNLVADMHRKVALDLVRRYQVIILPKFETSKMVRTLPKVVSRTISSLSHFKFRQRLIQKCREFGSTLVLVGEAYTSKTCGGCGQLNQTLKSSKVFHCPTCGLQLDRDLNGARNVLLRALRGTSIL